MVLLPCSSCCKSCGWGSPGVPDSVEIDVECNADGRSLQASVAASYPGYGGSSDDCSASVSFSLPVITGTYSLLNTGGGTDFFLYFLESPGNTTNVSFYQTVATGDPVFQAKFSRSGPATGSQTVSSTFNGTRTAPAVGVSFTNNPYEMCRIADGALTSERHISTLGRIFSGAWSSGTYFDYFNIRPEIAWPISSSNAFASGCQLPSTATATGVVTFDQTEPNATNVAVSHNFDTHSSVVISNGNVRRHTFSFSMVHKITAVRLIYGSFTRPWFFGADAVTC